MKSAEFAVVLRGYKPEAVDALVSRADQALASTDPELRASVREQLHSAALPTSMRGYDRQQVDEYLEQLADRLV